MSTRAVSCSAYRGRGILTGRLSSVRVTYRTQANTDKLAVLSGDTVIIRPKELPEKGKSHKERYVHAFTAQADNGSVLHIAGLSAPRLGSASREDEVGYIALKQETELNCLAVLFWI